ncbi:MAG: hypothetical protein HeimC2_37370 [Candidatus Heimdallarchaeota archaeon LC_2]|nr:MAG: hypothetical protein HeimC2_37370 [Candidatus Heimdallarchaeota archaeon LC_2]
MDENFIKPRMNSIYRILILSLLNSQPRSGYDLIICLEGIQGDRPSHGKIYPFLNELKNSNYISEVDIDCDLRSKVVYELTSKGETLLANTLGQLEVIFSNFLTSCCFCGIKYYSTNLEPMEQNENFCCEHCRTAMVIQTGN